MSSAPLGTGRIEEVGPNAGFYELAAGHEVLGHFDLVMRERFLPSGRVRFFPMSEVGEDRAVTSLLSGERCAVDARRFVDATYSKMQVPSTTTPSYAIAPGVACVPLNALPRMAPDYDAFVVIGAGKTAMDACVWMLENGVDPDRITWIVPRDSWVLNRANLQPGDEFFAAFAKSLADQVEAVALADSVDDVFARLEAAGELRRLDPTVTPTAYHCATLSDGELAQLRRIEQRDPPRSRHGDRRRRDPARSGHDPDRTDDAARRLLGGRDPRPSARRRSSTATGSRSSSCARVSRRSARRSSASSSRRSPTRTRRTASARRSRAPNVPLDWLKMLRLELVNRDLWMKYPQLGDWMVESRLDPVAKSIRFRLGEDPEAMKHIGRYLDELRARAGQARAAPRRLRLDVRDVRAEADPPCERRLTSARQVR